MNFFTSPQLVAFALVTGLLGATTAHAQDNHLVAVSGLGHKQLTETSFASASAASWPRRPRT